MNMKQSLLKIFTNAFKSSRLPKTNENTNSLSSTVSKSLIPHEPVFNNLFKNNRLAEYHLERSIYEYLIKHYLYIEDHPFVKISIIKDSSKGMIIGRLNYHSNINYEIFNIHLQHQLDNILKVVEFLFSSNCRNCGIEECIYRYLAIIAKEAGYTCLSPSNIMYTSKDLFDFSKPRTYGIFSFIDTFRNQPEEIENFKKEAGSDEKLIYLLNLLIETPLDYNLHDLITFDDIIKIDDLILVTNRKLSEIDKNYLIKMSRKLYCHHNNTSDKDYVFHEKCDLLSNIVHFLASEKLLIPESNNIILDGCMEKMGAHTVAIICGRQVDPTADQFMDDDQPLDPYADNSLYFQYYSCSHRKYEPEMISPYISLFIKEFKILSTNEFLSAEDNDLFIRSQKIQIFS